MKESNGYSFVESSSLLEISQVICGLFLQSFIIKIANKVSHLFLSRDHKRTHQFLDTLQEMIARVKIVDRPPFSNVNSLMLRELSSVIKEDLPRQFENYIQVYMKVRESNYTGYYFFPSWIKSKSFSFINLLIINI